MKHARENDESVYSCLLKNELLGASIEDLKGHCDERRALAPLERSNLFQVWQLYISIYSSGSNSNVYRVLSSGI
jgi:cell division cycle 20-like protein 1 (cofactor of APC complex)